MDPSERNADKPRNRWTDETRIKFETKERSMYLDPCQEAAERSIRCLNRNGGDRKFCLDYFQAYRDCKKEWTEKRRKRKNKEGAIQFG